MPVTIRVCRAEDLPNVAAMFEDLYGDAGRRTPPEPLMDRLSELFLVSEVDGQVVGFVIAAQGPVDAIGTAMAQDAFPNIPNYLEVQDLYVVPRHRNQGLGSMLMKAVLQRGHDAGLHHSMVYSSNHDYNRIGRFYEKFGYRIDHLFMKR